MMVKMCVRCAGEFCITCPDLDLAVAKLSSDYKTFNIVECVHADHCEHIKESIQKEMEERLVGLGNGPD